jgi:hypothetical protein
LKVGCNKVFYGSDNRGFLARVNPELTRSYAHLSGSPPEAEEPGPAQELQGDLLSSRKSLETFDES